MATAPRRREPVIGAPAAREVLLVARSGRRVRVARSVRRSVGRVPAALTVGRVLAGRAGPAVPADRSVEERRRLEAAG